MAGRKKPTGPFVGKEALTTVRLNTGAYAQVHAGEPVPGDILDADLLRLLDEGYIVEAPKGTEPESTPKAPAKPRGKAPAPKGTEPESTPAASESDDESKDSAPPADDATE